MIDLERLLDLLGVANCAIDLDSPCKSTYTAYWKMAQEELHIQINRANGKEYDFAAAAFAHLAKLLTKCSTIMCEIRVATEFWVGYNDGQYGNNVVDDVDSVYAQGNDFARYGEYIKIEFDDEDTLDGDDDSA